MKYYFIIILSNLRELKSESIRGQLAEKYDALSRLCSMESVAVPIFAHKTSDVKVSLETGLAAAVNNEQDAHSHFINFDHHYTELMKVSRWTPNPEKSRKELAFY